MPLVLNATGKEPVNVNQAVSIQLVATGGTTPYTFSVSAGTLPPGLTLGASSGLLSGQITRAGRYSFTLEVTDSATPPNTATINYIWVIGTPITGTIISHFAKPRPADCYTAGRKSISWILNFGSVEYQVFSTWPNGPGPDGLVPFLGGWNPEWYLWEIDIPNPGQQGSFQLEEIEGLILSWWSPYMQTAALVIDLGDGAPIILQPFQNNAYDGGSLYAQIPRPIKTTGVVKVYFIAVGTEFSQEAPPGAVTLTFTNYPVPPLSIIGGSDMGNIS